MAEKKAVNKVVEPTNEEIDAHVDQLVAKAQVALSKFEEFTQEQVDYIVAKCSVAGLDAHGTLAEAAVNETGRGVFEDKAVKNLFACEYVTSNLRHLKTVGIINEDPLLGITEIAEPVGVVCGIVPTTNPTSTVIFKSLICLKTRNPIIFSFHPSAGAGKGSTAAGLQALHPAKTVHCGDQCGGGHPVDRGQHLIPGIVSSNGIKIVHCKRREQKGREGKKSLVTLAKQKKDRTQSKHPVFFFLICSGYFVLDLLDFAADFLRAGLLADLLEGLLSVAALSEGASPWKKEQKSFMQQRSHFGRLATQTSRPCSTRRWQKSLARSIGSTARSCFST